MDKTSVKLNILVLRRTLGTIECYRKSVSVTTTLTNLRKGTVVNDSSSFVVVGSQEPNHFIRIILRRTNVGPYHG